MPKFNDKRNPLSTDGPTLIEKHQFKKRLFRVYDALYCSLNDISHFLANYQPFKSFLLLF